MVKLTYDRVKGFFEAKECILLMPEEEFNTSKVHCKSWFKIRSSCGHERLAHLDSFISFGCGVLCKECMSKRTYEPVDCSNVEYQGFCAIREAIQAEWEVFKMVEGTKADFALKPKSVEEDEWMAVQLKVTRKPVTKWDNYRFGNVNKNYDGMAVLCICLQDNRIWVFEGSQVVNVKHLQIGNKKSKYSSHEIIFTDLSNALLKFYDTLPNHHVHSLNVPIGQAQQREQMYRRKREVALPYIDFVYPEEEALRYDFKVGNLKIQEKVATQHRKRGQPINAYAVLINGGKPYKEGDNALYWINIPDSTMFYLFPEAVLIKHNLVKNDTNEVKTKLLLLHPNTSRIEHLANPWVNDYLFRYDTITQEEMTEILTTGHVTPKLYENKTRISQPDYAAICRERMAKAVGTKIECWKNDERIGSYLSIAQAARELNIKKPTLTRAVKENRKYNDYTFVKVSDSI